MSWLGTYGTRQTVTTENTPVPVCPYCGQPDSAIGLSSDTEIVCKNCEKEYVAKRIVKITFSTFKKEAK
jgi:DNA-directed RNA polymerase subunit RPC12/RpoP